ncbi:MAG: ParB N-terminal domain-containing protein [Parcubacteria group bacterium]|nr:ParB N-terminal domain-containing protein [Parcubacteria group bacterium]
MYKFTLESALKAKEQKKLHQWVINYLNDEGKNESLSKTLKKKEDCLLDLFEYPLDKLKRAMGYEKDMKFREDRNKWERRIRHFIKCIKNGETLPPIIATDFWDEIHISDGTHRSEALKRAGYKKYWTIFYIKDESNKQEVLNNISQTCPTTSLR